MCRITTGLTRSCRMSTGGLSSLYLGNAEDIRYGTGGTTFAADGSITNLVLNPGTSLYAIEVEKNTASVTQELQVGANRYVNAAITGSVSADDQAATNFMNQLSLAKVFAIYRKRGSGNYYIVGAQNVDGAGEALEVSAASDNSGAAEGDASIKTFTLSAPQTFYANQIDAATVNGLLAPIVTGFAPISGAVGSTVTISGQGFTGATSVSFGGTAQPTITVVNSRTITAAVPTGAADGVLSVTTPGGTLSSPYAFNVTP